MIRTTQEARVIESKSLLFAAAFAVVYAVLLLVAVCGCETLFRREVRPWVAVALSSVVLALAVPLEDRSR